MVAGYTRQAAANIQPGLRANAEDCNAEWNQLATAFDNTAGHDHTGSVAGDGAKISLTASVTGVLPIANGGSGSATNTPATLQVNPGGLLVGTAGAVPGTGALMLNANTVAPPPTGLAQAPQEWVVGANNTNPGLVLDGFGTTNTNAVPYILFRRARGTAAAPGTTQTGDYLGLLQAQGYGASAYGVTYTAGALQVIATENWTATAQGASVVLVSTPTGSTTAVSSLTLQGNIATFSGNVVAAGNLQSGSGSAIIAGGIVSIPNNTSLYLNGATGGVPGRIYGDGTNLFYVLPGAGIHQWENTAGTQLGYLDQNGNLVIVGATGQKASGTTWSNPSARDLKENIQDYSQGLQAILALQPRTYSFAADSGIDAPGPHIGLVHDETAHMPEMHRTLTIGSGDDAREVDGLDCSAITFALCNAIRELKAEIDELKAKLAPA